VEMEMHLQTKNILLFFKESELEVCLHV